ncbi:MAG TPA: pyridoxal-phosphate dependent enzyme [Candidatus Eremiobacteraceae bacterium]|nr:pyridoxal-phosphate dependent enzyme [Candidatus Eremiobacteraceae bacterium]
MRKRRPNSTNFFVGPDAIRKLLDPDCNPPLPLVELPERLNPFTAYRVRLFAKLMYLLPLLNLKSLPALNMMLNASRKLKGVHTIVENSSGNTAFSLAIVARLFGIRSVRALVPQDIAQGKLEMLRLSGAEISFAKNIGGIALARRIGKRRGFINLDQYANRANLAAHAKWTAKQVWEQTDGKLSVFCAGLGTTGTALGAIQFFKKQSSEVRVVGVYCLPDNAIPGVRSMEALEEISFPWKSKVPHRVGVSTKESFRKSLALCRAGLMAGPSSGFALAGLLKFIEQHADLDQLRNRDGQILACFVCPDSPFPYLDKYSTILDPPDFDMK